MCDDGEPTDQVTCERVLAIMSDEGSVAIQEWLGSDRETGPFESTSYVDTLYAPGEQAKVVSGQFFDEGGQANENGDNYDLATTILTMVLFFAGIAGVLGDRRVGWGLLVMAGVLLVGAGAYVVSLPLA